MIRLTFAVVLASALDFNPFAAKLDIIKTRNHEISMETDFHLGYELSHRGKSSEYHELRDEFINSFNFK